MPYPAIPRPQLGEHIVSGIVYALSVAANGVLTLSNDFVTFLAEPPNLYNVGRRISFTDTPGHQEINAMNTQQRNQVIIDRGVTADIQMFNVNNGTDTRPLVTLCTQLGYDYFYAEWVEGTIAGAIYTNQLYGVRAEVDGPLEGRGEQLTTLHLNECDPGYPTIPQFYRYVSG